MIMKESKYVDEINYLYKNKTLSFDEKDKLLDKYRYGTLEEKTELDNDYKSFLKDFVSSKEKQGDLGKLDRIKNKLLSISDKVSLILWFIIIVLIINLYFLFKYLKYTEQLRQMLNF